MRSAAPRLLVLAGALAVATGSRAADARPDRAAAQAAAQRLADNWGPVDEAYSAAFATIAERRWGDGEAAFAKALELVTAAGRDATHRAGLLAGRATVRLNLGRFADARADNDAALTALTGPRDRVNALFEHVAIARALGDFRLATDTLRGLDRSAPAAWPDAAKATTRRLALEEARNRRAWGDLAGAVEKFEEARVLDDQSADGLRELAACHLLAGAPALALPVAQRALEQDLHLRGVSRRRPRDQWVEAGDASLLASLRIAADCALAARDHAAALAHYETAAALAAKLALAGEAKLSALGRARVLVAALDARAAEITPAFLDATAADLERSVPEARLRLEILALAGELALAGGHPAAAVKFLSAAAALVEQARATATVEERRTFLAVQADSYRRLATAATRAGDAWTALLAAESLKGRLLQETIQPGHDRADASVAQRLAQLREFQRRLPADVAAISYANADWARTPPVAIAITRDGIKAVELAPGRLKFALELLPAAEILKAQKRDVDASRYDLGDEVTLAGLIAYYRECLTCKGEEIAARQEPQLAIMRLLHDFLLEPLRPALGGRKRLLISPSGLLAYLPFETLADRERRLLVGDHAITLTPSLFTTLALAARPAATFARPMLALGGAVYNPATYERDMRGAEQMKLQFGQMLVAARKAAFAPGRSPYAGVFGGPMNNLAGTQAEVQMLGELLPGTRVVLGREVNEKNVRALAAAGELRSSRVVHFAVHGAALPSRPALSCIALSYEGHFTSDLPAERDGLLQLAEIQQLPLRAELVTLSACETGLGAILAGEGVVGLTGAFLSAGGDRVLASLWPVNDAGTTYFMQRFYKLHLVDGQPGDLAMAAVKREFITGQAGGFRAPQFWAPFNLYGGADLLGPAAAN
ncbi:MAG: CHAT domain-containing protein [Opitutaceae bacterium]|nr:CHAT domain-containing protein [Opitutaceae bacterium]